MDSACLYVSKETLIISINNNPLTAIDRMTLKAVTVPPLDRHDQIPFFSILGLYKFEDSYFLVLITEIEEVSSFNKIHRVKSFSIVSIRSESNKFRELLRIGLNQCHMYLSLNEKYDITLSYQQQFENINSRGIFTWNYEAIKCLKECWPSANNYTLVIGGFVQQAGPFLLISRKGNKNVGCHTWSRGSDINGHVANFAETEEIFFINDEHLISHVMVRGSCPLFWSQHPTMQITQPFRYGPIKESKRRFNKHFDFFEELYGKNFVIASLTEQTGKEKEMSKLYEEFSHERKLIYKDFSFNTLMMKPGEVRRNVSTFLEDADFCEVKDGKICHAQKKFIRVNCASCLDRTNVFMAILSNMMLHQFGEFDEDQHTQLWIDQAHQLAEEYAGTRGLKSRMTSTGNQTLVGQICDMPIVVKRYTNSLWIEGTITDALAAVSQEKPCTKFQQDIFIEKIFFFLQLIVVALYTLLVEGKRSAVHHWRTKIRTILDHPHFEDLRDADEFDDNDFESVCK